MEIQSSAKAVIRRRNPCSSTKLVLCIILALTLPILLYLYFPSEPSKGRILCIKGHDTHEGKKNLYALAWPESLPRSATLLKGLTFVSDTYYDYENLWHGLSAIAPFVGWSIKNECLKPTRWVLFHWGEAVVMRHNAGRMAKERKLQVFDLLRCKARSFCRLSLFGRGKEVNARREPVVRLTLLMRRDSRSFADPTAVISVFEGECALVEGCMMEVAQSEDLSFCDQVKVMTNIDIVASPHGAQLTNMIFMDRNSSVMEFFPKDWSLQVLASSTSLDGRNFWDEPHWRLA
ncbi:uncharacterized protein LOC112092041 [Morus notabilis]|uniref:uncharacterized protein LOC112092041 n=1 Tax=Morus notabilis TaxID=981085 RepID=UPI000CED2321|nr:uncharacterized protein LOC112092041 [Morus notabilis]